MMDRQFGLMEDLRQLLIEGKVTSQEGICATLAKKGHTVNQSKVSRLLRRIGAIKSKNELGEVVYRLPREPAPPTARSQLSSLTLDVVANENLILVNTSPGSAQLIARVLDYHKDRLSILGTIAGDDTVLVMPKHSVLIDKIVKHVRSVLWG